MTEYPDVSRQFTLVQDRMPMPWYERPSWLAPSALAVLVLAYFFACALLALE